MDYDKYLAGLDMSRLPPEARHVLIALGQSQCGEPVDQICPHCNGKVLVDAKTLPGEARPCAWFISCLCGKCSMTMRGL